ncbi:TIGR03088 family PEP-CTERM/XrtA system glycosyltransferase [Ferribacterium limneticum]|uniref:TIGR03088 family PEP-CTERM/XrtA system glycosyltransferase n=1 Tax=Ferribacterium limneticum TaxID=76259 RepID=UPI001CFC40DE|nr:TIGR03088 family PEP-CTERM/XrtA system glycosyltransferase [Ferribacterium limneticum]UCV17328.1 TIGR03088 family PEP-CTERM/XrtA system glycosyltransferase [Ferribacterium limneticum]
MSDGRPLVAHIMHRFDTGGLENGVVNLINHMPADAYRHAIISLTEITDFKKRIQRPDVQFFALNKKPGHALWIYPQLYRLFRQLRPTIVHTRNLAALEASVPAWAARVPARIHGEHGRDVGDFDGTNKKCQWIRRIYSPFVKHYIVLSQDLAHYLINPVGIGAKRVTQIYNGVDAVRFHPAPERQDIPGSPFNEAGLWLVGTAGRMQTVKDQTNLARAFVLAINTKPSLRQHLRLVMVGDGPLRHESLAILETAGLAELAWLPGERNDIPEIMRGLDCFVLPSLGEGISNTILEAMASGLPVIATKVGGNPELVQEGRTGHLVPAADPGALARAIINLAQSPEKSRAMGYAGRKRIEAQFSMTAMIDSYQQIYDRLLGRMLRSTGN